MSEFPSCIVDALVVAFDATDWADTVLKRPLRANDPADSVGIFVFDWKPIESQIGMRDVSMARYGIRIQHLSKYADEEEGREAHSRCAKTIRAMLYRGTSVSVPLQGINESVLGFTERVTRWGVLKQKYLSEKVNSGFIFISGTEMWVETETV